MTHTNALLTTVFIEALLDTEYKTMKIVGFWLGNTFSMISRLGILSFTFQIDKEKLNSISDSVSNLIIVLLGKCL